MFISNMGANLSDWFLLTINVCCCQSGLNISETADYVESLHTAVPNVYREQQHDKYPVSIYPAAKDIIVK